MLKEMKPENRYFVINIDEPYAEKIYEILKAGQMKKGEWPEGDISFNAWIDRTFNFEIGEHPDIGIVDVACKKCGKHLVKDKETDYHRQGKCCTQSKDVLEKCPTPGCDNYTEIPGLSCSVCFFKSISKRHKAKRL